MNSQAIGVVTALLAGLAMGVGYAAVVQPLAALGILTLLFGGAVVTSDPFCLLRTESRAYPTADNRPLPLPGSPHERPVEEAALDVNNAISRRSIR